MGTIETGALRLVQRQVPPDFATISLAAKVRKDRLCGALSSWEPAASV